MFPSPAVICSPPCLLSKTGHTHRQHRLTSSDRKPLNFHVVSTAIQYLHRKGTSLTSSWNGVPPSETSWHFTAIGRITSTPCYDVPRKSSYPRLAGPFRTQSRTLFTSHRTAHLVAKGHFVRMCFFPSFRRG